MIRVDRQRAGVLENDEPVKILLDLEEALWALLTVKPDDGACRH
jgi:hypothetical protein